MVAGGRSKVSLPHSDAVATFLRSWPLSVRKRWKAVATGANGQPAVAGYLWDEQAGAYRPETIIVLTMRAARIAEISAFRSPELFPLFGLREQITTPVDVM
jgi:RNA polymerase sigma-70 factor (ECF subfamily)